MRPAARSACNQPRMTAGSKQSWVETQPASTGVGRSTACLSCSAAVTVGAVDEGVAVGVGRHADRVEAVAAAPSGRAAALRPSAYDPTGWSASPADDEPLLQPGVDRRRRPDRPGGRGRCTIRAETCGVAGSPSPWRRAANAMVTSTPFAGEQVTDTLDPAGKQRELRFEVLQRDQLEADPDRRCGPRHGAGILPAGGPAAATTAGGGAIPVGTGVTVGPDPRRAVLVVPGQHVGGHDHLLHLRVQRVHDRRRHARRRWPWPGTCR